MTVVITGSMRVVVTVVESLDDQELSQKLSSGLDLVLGSRVILEIGFTLISAGCCGEGFQQVVSSVPLILAFDFSEDVISTIEKDSLCYL